MTKTRFFPPLVLLALLLASCAPAASPAPSVDQPPVQEPASPVVVEPSATPIPDTVEAPAESAAPTPLPVATSRGPDLHATDPATVSLASGQLQFVEFFRFTWGTCRSMAPMVHGLEAKYFGRLNFVYLDADDRRTQPFQQELGFRYQPEIYLLDGDGNILKKWVGFTSEQELEEEFAKHLP